MRMTRPLVASLTPFLASLPLAVAVLAAPAAAQAGSTPPAAAPAKPGPAKPAPTESAAPAPEASDKPAPDEGEGDDKGAAGEGGTGEGPDAVVDGEGGEAAAPRGPGDVSGVGPALQPGKAGVEEICDDGIDNDEDSVTDCADADCDKAASCQPDGDPENTNARCTDWIDNDDDGFIDCDDEDCLTGTVTACQGSWDRPAPGAVGTPGGDATPSDEIPELGAGMTVEDLIGKGGDKDGERSDQLCSDGFDNDGDGKIDCADIGCRFDPQVAVCRGTPGLRFSVVANLTNSMTLDRRETKDLTQEPAYLVGNLVNDVWGKTEFDTRITALQLRVFGPIPGIQDSFFLLSGRAENTPRLTFAMASFPIGWGHFINVNSGGGGISNNLVLSQHKRALVDSPFYLYNAFEQGNGAAVEVNGPIVGGWLDYRAYVAGGAGFFDGNVGGRFIAFDNTNYTFSGGGQLLFTPIGYASRWDSQYLYTPVPAALLMTFGARFDRRAQEMFPAVNMSMMFRWWHLLFQAENYSKYEIFFGSAQTAYNFMFGALLWPKWVMFAADFGQFYATPLMNPPANLETDLRRQNNEFMVRAALHIYVWKSVGVVSFVVRDRYVGPGVEEGQGNIFDPSLHLARLFTVTQNERQAKMVLQFRF